MPLTYSRADYLALRDHDCGFSSWLQVAQDRITKFAEATGDMYFIHTDPVRAAATRFGGTIAHGMLTLSLVPGLAYEVLPLVAGTQTGVNMGFDRVRFITPVRSGSRIRAGFRIRQVTEPKPDQLETLIDVVVQIENVETPAAIAEWRGRVFL